MWWSSEFAPPAPGHSSLETMTQEDYTPELEIPFALADQWDEMLRTKGKCATYWEIANWAYQRGRAEQRELQAK